MPSPEGKDSVSCKSSSSETDSHSSPLDFLDLDPHLIQEIASLKRHICPQCKKSFQHYCCSCAIPLGHVSPQIHLPVKLDIYRHPQERPSKSTAVHAKLIAPESTEIFVYNLRDDLTHFKERYKDCADRTLLLYPSSSSKELSEIPADSYDRLIVIDGTWTQARQMISGILSCEKTHPIRHVRIASHQTMFWRHQKLSLQYLATIEAMYWFFRDWWNVNGDKMKKTIEGPDHIPLESLQITQSADSSTRYDGRFDPLMLYFCISYQRIQKHYQETKKPFTKAHIQRDTYIKYEKPS